MSFGRLPVLFAFDEAKIRAQLDAKKARAGVPLIVLPFNDQGAILTVPVERFRYLRSRSREILAHVRRMIGPEPQVAIRFELWHKVIVQGYAKHFGSDEWRAFVLHWTLDKQGGAFKDGNDLAEQFFLTEVCDDRRNAHTSAAVTVLKNHLAPEPSQSGLIQLAFDLEQERNRDELFRYFAPRVIVLAANLFPITRVPLLLGQVAQAILGFVEFMQFLEEAEEDGDVSDEEIKEAQWQLLGIVPFQAVQVALLARGAGLIAFAFLRALRSGLAELADLVVRMNEVFKEGWNGYGEYDLETAVFLPDYVIPSEDE